MNTLIQISRFDGGHAEDIRSQSNIGESEKSLNFDIFTNTQKLLPYRDTKTEGVTSGLITDFVLNGVILIGSTYYTVGMFSAAVNKPTFYTKTNITDSWQAQNSGAAGSTIINGTLISYKGVAYVLAYDSSNRLLLIDSTGTTKGTSATAIASSYNAAIFVHPEDNVLYMVRGNVISKWDGSTFSELATALPLDSNVSSITDYGTYLAIGCITGGKSIVYLWGRDMTLNTFQGTIPFGEGTLFLLENITNVLVGICTSVGSLATNIAGQIDVKVYSGGVVQVVKSLTMATAITNISNYKTKYNDGLFFGFGNDTNLYQVRKNKEGRWSITKDRYILNGTAIGSAAPIPTILNGLLWVSFATGTSGQFYRNWVISESNTYVGAATYKTTINPKMTISDRSKNKRLNAVRVLFTGKTNGTIQVKYSVDGSVFTSLIPASGDNNSTTTAKEDVREANAELDGTQFLEGREFQFQLESTGGVEIKSLEYEYEKTNTLL